MIQGGKEKAVVYAVSTSLPPIPSSTHSNPHAFQVPVLGDFSPAFYIVDPISLKHSFPSTSMTPSSPLLPLWPSLLSKLCEIFFLFPSFSSSVSGFGSQTFPFLNLVAIYVTVSPKCPSWALPRHLYLDAPSDSAWPKLTLSSFPKTYYCSSCRQISGNGRHGCPHSCLSHKLGYYSLSLTPTAYQSPSAMKSISWVSITFILLSVPPLGPDTIYLSSKCPKQLLTHLSVHCLPLIPREAKETLLNHKSDHITSIPLST